MIDDISGQAKEKIMEMRAASNTQLGATEGGKGSGVFFGQGTNGKGNILACQRSYTETGSFALQAATTARTINGRCNRE